MNRIRRFLPILIIIAAMFVPTMAQAQLVSTAATVSLSYSVPESISVVASPTSLTLTTNPQTVNITATYNLATTRTALGLFAYLGSSTAALAGGGINLPSSDILMSATPSPGPCTGGIASGSGYSGLFDGVGVAGANCGSLNYNLSFGGGAGTFTATPAFNINPSATIPVGSFTGTLFIVATTV